MIEAISHPSWTPLVRAYLRSSLHNHFARVLVHNDPDQTTGTTLFHATHQSWWDGHLMLALCQHLGLEFRTLMLERELGKYGFLRYAGACGFTPGKLSSVREMMRYAKTQLGQDNTGLVIFPAGEILPASTRPLPYQHGMASLLGQLETEAHKKGQAKTKPQTVQVRAVAIRLEHRGLGKPEALIRVGPASQVASHLGLRNLTAQLQHELSVQADLLEQDLLHTASNEIPSHYSSIITGLSSAQQRWDALRQTLGLLRPVKP